MKVLIDITGSPAEISAKVSAIESITSPNITLIEFCKDRLDSMASDNPKSILNTLLDVFKEWEFGEDFKISTESQNSPSNDLTYRHIGLLVNELDY